MSALDYSLLQKLIEIDSPSGYTDAAAAFTLDVLRGYGWKPELTNKGAVRCSFGENPVLSIAAHIDTLGAVVSKIRSDGTLRFSLVGSPSYNSIEGEYVRVRTIDDKVFHGTIQIDDPAKHVNAKIASIERSNYNMHVRLDEEVFGSSDVRALGIRNGDMVCFDTRYQELPSGYIKSRFLDNKAGCFVLFEIARLLAEQKKTAPVEIFFSNFEEVGHGGAGGYAPSVKDLLVIDMGVVGSPCDGDERHCSICAKDSSGPYDYNFRRDLVRLAEANNIPYQLDVYPYYSSDGSAALKAGQQLRVALIGPGVAASHGNERAHKRGIQATVDLCMAYIDKMQGV